MRKGQHADRKAIVILMARQQPGLLTRRSRTRFQSLRDEFYESIPNLVRYTSWPPAGSPTNRQPEFHGAYRQFFMAANNNPPMGSGSGSPPRSARFRSGRSECRPCCRMLHVWSCSVPWCRPGRARFQPAAGGAWTGPKGCCHEACQGAIQTCRCQCANQDGAFVR